MNCDKYLSRRGAEKPHEFAAKLEVNKDQLRQWRRNHRGAKTPPAKAADMERLTGGLIRVEHERPDLVWVRVPDPTWPHPAGRPAVDVSRPAAIKAAKVAA